MIRDIAFTNILLPLGVLANTVCFCIVVPPANMLMVTRYSNTTVLLIVRWTYLQR